MDNKLSYSSLVGKIAELERENDSLHRRSYRLERAAEVITLGIMEWCSSSGVSYYNADFLSMTGLTHKEMDSFSFDFWLTRLHPDDRNDTNKIIDALLKGEINLSNNEFRISHPKKKWVWLYDISKVITRDSEGFPLCIISVLQDISIRKHIDEELSEVRTTLENILNSIIPICVTNMQYDIMLTNESYNSIFGKPTHGMRCFESRSGPSCHTERCPIHHINEGTDELTCEITKEGSGDTPDKTFIVTARPFYGVQNEVIGLVESFQDITERTLLENDKNQLIEKLQKALTQVKQLSGFLPICASCKKIRDDSGYWNQIETYIRNHSEAEFSHSLCPDCAQKLYPDLGVNKKPD